MRIFLINWVHFKLKIPKDSIRQCLFGLHLLNETQNRLQLLKVRRQRL